MTVCNIHRRRLPGPALATASLVDGLASADDRLWPHQQWPAMRLDGPLAVGARGGHGPIRYRVAGYEPGRSVRFRFTGPAGFDGEHRFEVVGESDGSCELRHVVEMNLRGGARLTWPLVFDLLDGVLA